MKILIVDDSSAMRMLVKRALRQAGFGHHTVVEAANGNEALEAVKSADPDLVLSDWNMPELNGIELLQRLRAQRSRVKFGFLTSESTSEMRDAAIAAGAQFLLPKPITTDRLQQTLTPYLGAAQAS